MGVPDRGGLRYGASDVVVEEAESEGEELQLLKRFLEGVLDHHVLSRHGDAADGSLRHDEELSLLGVLLDDVLVDDHSLARAFEAAGSLRVEAGLDALVD